MNARMDADGQASGRADRVLEIEGTVQGVGFRPFVARLAERLAVSGWVRNDGRGVSVRIAGPENTLDRFCRRATIGSASRGADHVGARAADERVDGVAADVGRDICHSRERLRSDGAHSGGHARPRDLPGLPPRAGDARRPAARLSVINCTNCGPRYSIVEALPYDRARTTMARFALCPDCAREYADPANRRYHAQANACPACGPQVQLQDRGGHALATRDAAIAGAAEALRAGRIVAVKGVGGFHLMVDAANETGCGNSASANTARKNRSR